MHDHRYAGVGGQSKSQAQEDSGLIARAEHVHAIGDRVQDDLGRQSAAVLNSQNRLRAGVGIQFVRDLQREAGGRRTSPGGRAGTLLNSPDR